ncbi:SMI1/KNR4 family protein [Streptomyces sp. NPDC093546]|uniref:SMI1/KNR4 family protein n=1 Tax=Streptomyces sp. NPDC093546 TaxID=3366040 RepID=UPI0037F58927
MHPSIRWRAAVRQRGVPPAQLRDVRLEFLPRQGVDLGHGQLTRPGLLLRPPRAVLADRQAVRPQQRPAGPAHHGCGEYGHQGRATPSTSSRRPTPLRPATAPHPRPAVCCGSAPSSADAVDAPPPLPRSPDPRAAAEARLGVTLSDELKVLYGVTRVDYEDDFEEADRAGEAVGCELSGLDYLYAITGPLRHHGWDMDAKRAVSTAPDAAVQGLAGSTGWIGFGSNGGDEFAVDLTPGPGGHFGQIILVDHEKSLGAILVADSLTDLVLGRLREERRGLREDQLPAVGFE